ncbi:MAG: cation:dicarboxylase symporter family transporter, partial [Acidobacteriota bacterium]
MKLPKISLTWKIMIGLVLGIFLGWLLPEWGIAARPLSTLFLNLIKSIIAPLIFATLVIGISGTGDIKQVGRIGIKALVYFEIVTTLALFIGLAAVNITRPGDGVSLAGVVKTEDKAVLADRAKGLAKESGDAAKLAEELRSQAATNPNLLAEAEAQSAIAANKAAEAADVAARGLTAPEPPPKPQSFGDIIAHLSPTSIIKAMAEG